jgi:N-acetylglucosaminyl-diphospho-decaprenol L-rhamnosyltransferase
MNKYITVLILTHKSRELLLNYIKNIYKKFKIIVIDNSNDVDLEKYLKKNYPEITIKLIENNGYGNAINFGSKLVETKYFLASNPDLQGIDEKSLLKFLSVADSLKDKFSTIGPRYKNVNPKSLVQSDESKEISEIKVISGACMFFNKKNFDAIGGFDENFFLYFEEADLCRRIKLKGGKVYTSSKLLVDHYGHKGSAATDPKYSIETEMFRNWHWMWSSFYYKKKYSNYLIALGSMFGKLARSFIKMIFFTIVYNKKKQTMYYARFAGLINSMLGKKSWYRVKSLFD